MIFDEQKSWELQRLGKFTASDLYKLLQSGRTKHEYFGKGAMAYIREKLAEIITGQPIKDLSGLNAIEWGNAHEFEAIREFQERKGIEELIYYGGANPAFFEFNKYSGCSPDAETPTHIIECKCPYNSGVHVENLLGSMSNDPEWMVKNRYEHYVQIQFNMMCRGKESGYYISYDPRAAEQINRLAIIEVRKDTSMAEEIEKRIDNAANLIKQWIGLLENQPSIITAHYDKEVNATIIQ